ncbi:PREDICTED: uncharacterized protein LOC100632574 [Amphimedon queenslandica]|uniref:Reverse transcriptase domain-containing protein n=1 Tax=Amphimedon queenslandica TaxID=400682 RepID=A0AAN0J054_AMPQE|nr:PREDICTED: uncharacterized protein LOC100632574 [Amphimedon queenslandica]|eukprot:XP_019850167.1 PREDICTED: uncharacterized protein LOC100632574 [Amphimedon queenslandica]
MVEKVDNPEVIQGDRVHYLPHHAVIRKDKETTKLRVVYDASAKQHGPSLNDCLLPGPKLQQEIFNVLITFRAHKVAFAADIEKAFLNIAVAPQDRDVLRFLWISSLDNPSDIAVFRFTRVMFGVNCSPFLLNATVRTHLEQFVDEYTEIVPKLMDAIYVDDIVSGAHTEEATEEIFYTAKQLLSKAGFNLRKFISNSEVLQQKVELQEERAKNDKGESYAKLAIGKTVEPVKGETKVLGVLWDVKKDLFVFRIKTLAKEAREIHPTKRQVISVTSKFFDPLGLFSPLIIKFKVFFQKLCVSKVDWDDVLKGEQLKTWHLLVEGLSQVDTITVPRCYTTGVEDSKPPARLYGFCDASITAYAAVVYLVVQSEVAPHSTLVASKTRVAPLHKQTIPRLELLSAVLLSRLVTTVQEVMMKTFDMEQTICYTDSEITMHWIKGHDKAWKPFVRNRVQEIRQRIPSEFWYHCISQDNPADIPSRGLAAQELQQCQMWWHGPAWKGKGDYENGEMEIPKECKSELRSRERSTVLLTKHIGSQDSQNGSKDSQDGSQDAQDGSQDSQDGSKDSQARSQDSQDGSKDSQVRHRSKNSQVRHRSKDSQVGSQDSQDESKDSQVRCRYKDSHEGSQDPQIRCSQGKPLTSRSRRVAAQQARNKMLARSLI